MIETVGVVGLGLIGGSVAKAIRTYTGCALYGYDADGAVLSRAVEEGVLSGVLTPEGLSGCDLVIVALYPEATVDYVTRHRSYFRRDGLVMDTGGVKSVVCSPLEAVAREGGFHFIGGHPMAGIERSGYANAFPELFRGASLILTPYAHTPERCVSEIWSLFQKLGYGVTPRPEEDRHDIIQVVELEKREALIAFCRGVQKGAPVDSFVVPEPSPMPGYDCDVIMAAGAFTLGASIELSADAPLREPYAAWMQGGLNYHSGQLGMLLAAQELLDEGLLQL